MRRVRAIARKEWLHLGRDPRSLLAALAMPAVLLLLYGYAVNYDLTELKFAIVDEDRSATSRRLGEVLSSVPGFRCAGGLARADDADAAFQSGWARVVVVFPPGFERRLQTGRESAVQVLVDGSEGTTANIALTYAHGAVSLLGQRQMGQQALVKGLSKQLLAQAVELRPRVLYNPDLESRRFLVPGLIGIILMMMAALLTSGVVVRERERGTFELLAASPVSAAELLVGKLLPYLALGAFDVVLAVGVGWGVFGVVPQGNLLLLFALAMVFVLCSLSIGLFFSCVAPTQQLAMLLGFVTTVLPTMILSGFAFPVRNMPVFLQGVSQLLPATHFIAIARGIVLKGVGIGPVWDHVVALSVITAVLMRLALKRFRKTL